jgi:sigma-E factor negative regulatory protein RseA
VNDASGNTEGKGFDVKDQISALLDGELDEVEARRLIERLKVQPELRRTWDDYHLIGDALRGHLGRDVSAAVTARLAAEAVVLAPRPKTATAQRVARWSLSVAAGLAAVALVAWMALPVYGPSSQLATVTPPQGVPSARQGPAAEQAGAFPQVALAPRPATAPLSARDKAEADARAQAEALSALGVGNYLLAHQRFSPSSAMQGVAPYVRSVSAGGYDR